VRRLIGSLACLLIGSLAVAACGGAQAGGGDPGAAAGGTGLTVFPAGDRGAAPRVRGELLDGADFDSADHRGQVLVYNVWGSWCVPCRAEAPALRQVSAETRGQRVQFVGIDTRDNRDAARAFERRYGITYPSVFDADGQALLVFRGIVPMAAVPTTVVVDRDGKVAARIIGRARIGQLREAVRAGAGGAATAVE
jgi:thiol-disulfide isomerase/thioredoxin